MGNQLKIIGLCIWLLFSISGCDEVSLERISASEKATISGRFEAALR